MVVFALPLDKGPTMTKSDSQPNAEPTVTTPSPAEVLPRANAEVPEIGGRDGLDPTRYGDWEKNGRCIDF